MRDAVWVFIAAGIFVVWVLSLYAWPFKPCPRCGGKGTNKGSTGKRFGTCKRCGGGKGVARSGSKFVHRTVLAMAAERKRAREKKAREKGSL